MLRTVVLAAMAAALLHAAASAAAPSEATIQTGVEGAKAKLSVKPHAEDVFPKATNPYQGKAYAGCEGGFCPAEDAALEKEFFLAAEKGQAKVLKKLLSNDKLNMTRNIVPDSEGLTRVIDVAMWAASRKGHHDAMKVLLEHPGVKELFQYEDGHIVDLAAANGHLGVVKLLLEHNMPVGPGAMAHAAHYNHSDIMSVSSHSCWEHWSDYSKAD
eukprot:GHUV01038823.1.p1 GENE.GHUV01038823.1~~GHUV01038823.1.p1  ORF type:complete len:214 (+),score=54.56 GHUV01038823.1:630-1271(+)